MNFSCKVQIVSLFYNPVIPYFGHLCSLSKAERGRPEGPSEAFGIFFVMIDVTQLQFSKAKQEVFFVFLLSLLVIFTVIVSVKTN